jgi:uncharacterized protein
MLRFAEKSLARACKTARMCQPLVICGNQSLHVPLVQLRRFSQSDDQGEKNNDGGGAKKPIQPRRVFNQTLETPHQRAFGQEAYLDEINDDRQTITGWGIGQFKINNRKVTGPIILTKTMTFRWKLELAHPTVKDLKIEDFELFRMFKPALDLIVLGTGNNIQYPPKEFLKQLREIAPVEVLDSVNTGATFNVLSKEDRQVAAALLPVQEW